MVKEDRKGKAPLRTPKELNWERRMSKLKDEQARREEERSKEMLGVQQALTDLTRSLKDPKSGKEKKRKLSSSSPNEETKVLKKSPWELLERADDSEEESDASEREHYFDSDADRGDQSERSGRSDSSEEEDTIDIKPSENSAFVPSKDQTKT